MAVGPVFTYDAYIISPGVDLTLTGVGTPYLTATYGDYGGSGEAGGLKATCTIVINYTNLQYTINNDSSITVTGEINGAVLKRRFVASSTNQQELTTWFNNQQTFHQTIGTSQAGEWDLNIPNAFSVTIQPSHNPQTQWPAAIHYKNHNTRTTLPPDEFYFGLGILNPNPPDYRPGAVLDSGLVWQSHNRTGGDSHILGTNGNWIEMRTLDGGSSSGNPPSIRKNDKWVNQRKIGKE
jgi:hypothetical protein